MHMHLLRTLRYPRNLTIYCEPFIKKEIRYNLLCENSKYDSCHDVDMMVKLNDAFHL